MRVEYEEMAPDGYVEIADAAKYVSRSVRTIYDWIEREGVRTFRRREGRALVLLVDVVRVEAIRHRGRRRKPRPPAF